MKSVIVLGWLCCVLGSLVLGMGGSTAAWFLSLAFMGVVAAVKLWVLTEPDGAALSMKPFAAVNPWSVDLSMVAKARRSKRRWSRGGKR